MEGIFYPNFSLLDGRAISPSMDDRSGCTVLVELIKNLKVKSLLYDLYVVFTAQEEIGVKGARTSAYDITPDLGIAIDVTSCFDYLEPRMSAVELGKGPAVKVMDGGMITNMELRSKIIEVAEKIRYRINLMLKQAVQLTLWQCRFLKMVLSRSDLNSYKICSTTKEMVLT